MAEIFKFEKAQAAVRQIGGFVMTETATDILRTLKNVQSIDGTAMTYISGGTGIGKTRALIRFCQEQKGQAIYHSVVKGQGNPYDLATLLMGLYLDDASISGLEVILRGKKRYADLGNDLNAASAMIADEIGPDRILVIDEGQNLNQRHKKTSERGASFGWLQGLAEQGCFKLILCGDLTLAPMIEADQQLHSRMIRWRKIKSASRADVAAFLSATDLDTPEVVEVLHHVARRPGGLRNVEQVIWDARIFAGEGALTPAHVRAAIIDLGLEPKGGA